MNAAVLYVERDPGLLAERLHGLGEVVRLLELYGYATEVYVNQPPKRGVRYDVGVVISQEDAALRSGLFFRFLKLEPGIAYSVRKVLDERIPEKRTVFKLYGLTDEEKRRLTEEIVPEGVSVKLLTEGLDTALCARSERPEELDVYASKLCEIAGKSLYSDRDETPAECALRLLRFYKKRLSVGESLTGGLLADSLVRIPGASEVLSEGAVTYANEAKTCRLGVKEETLRKYGAVSEQTAYEMCQGLLATGLCDWAISTTGIAGPGGGSAAKPVGTVYIGVASREQTTVYKHCFTGNREEVRTQSCTTALFYLIQRMKNKVDYASYRVK